MKKTKLILASIAILIFVVIIVHSCRPYYFRTNYEDANKLMHDSKYISTKLFLKAHLKNGDVCILKDTWTIDTAANIVWGSGIRYDFNRLKTYKGSFKIPIDSVSIFETNSKLTTSESDRVALLSILAATDVLIGVLCLTNPKACFGSCPTFYLNEKDNFHYADAEGFSDAIAPSLEAFDIDALNNKTILDKQFSITMKNEALETHCVNSVKLLAYPRNKGERIYQTRNNDFYLCNNKYNITKAKANEGDITSLLQNEDMQERFSLSDENNLSSKEDIYLNFDNVNNYTDLGLIIHFRQTLMTTYFIYNAIGYMGDEVGDIFAKVEREKTINDKLKGGFKKELGDIDVYVWNEINNTWELSGGIYETGPIAINKQIIPLKTKATNKNIKLKLVLNKGLWRLDYLALTNIKEKVKPIEIDPYCILNKGKLDNIALNLINDPTKYLVSMPGSEYKFKFELPEQHQDYELFLYSKGYYLEWMRKHWLKDKDLLKLKQLFDNPKKYLKDQAKEYKCYESIMEQEFWNSKIDTKSFSYYEK